MNKQNKQAAGDENSPPNPSRRPFLVGFLVLAWMGGLLELNRLKMLLDHGLLHGGRHDGRLWCVVRSNHPKLH